MEKFLANVDELIASIARDQESLEEAKRAAAERAAEIVGAAQSEPPTMAAIVQELGGFQETLAGVQAEEVRNALTATYQDFLGGLKARIPTPERSRPGSPPPPADYGGGRGRPHGRS